MKVRYYGLLASASKKKLHKLRKMIHLDSESEKVSNEEQVQTQKVLICPICQNPLIWIETFFKGESLNRDHQPS